MRNEMKHPRTARGGPRGRVRHERATAYWMVKATVPLQLPLE